MAWALLVLISSIPISALAAELRVEGFFENVFPHVDQNTSDQDLDMTRNDDQIFFGRERVRLFFDFIASDDLRGALALEIDATYGAPRFNRVGSRCVLGTGVDSFNQCGFRNGIDTNILKSRTFTSISVSLSSRSETAGRSAVSPPTSPRCTLTCSIPSMPVGQCET